MGLAIVFVLVLVFLGAIRPATWRREPKAKPPTWLELNMETRMALKCQRLRLEAFKSRR